MSRMKLMALMAAAMVTGMDSPFNTERRVVTSRVRKTKAELAEDKGLKCYDFHYVDGVPMFSCYALNQKSADKKYAKWLNSNKVDNE